MKTREQEKKELRDLEKLQDMIRQHEQLGDEIYILKKELGLIL